MLSLYIKALFVTFQLSATKLLILTDWLICIYVSWSVWQFVFQQLSLFIVQLMGWAGTSCGKFLGTKIFRGFMNTKRYVKHVKVKNIHSKIISSPAIKMYVCKVSYLSQLANPTRKCYHLQGISIISLNVIPAITVPCSYPFYIRCVQEVVTHFMQYFYKMVIYILNICILVYHKKVV